MLHGFLKQPGLPWRDFWVQNDLTSLQNAVGGYIETMTVRDDLVLLMGEEGMLKDKPLTCHVGENELRGNVILLGVQGDEFTDVPISQVEWLRLLTELAAEAESYVGRHAARA